ncbi:MAG TPA: exopolysaccharide biosynthesis polyprenyl glycosylphosphotransferase [Sphingobium sp.]
MLLSARNQNAMVDAGTLPGSVGSDAVGDYSVPANDRGRSRNKFQMRLMLRFALLASEIVAIIATFGVAAYIRHGVDGLDQWLTLMFVTLPVYLGTALNSKAYDLDAIRDFRTSAKRSIMAFLFTIGTVMLMVFFLKASTDFSRLVFGMATVMCVPILLGLRLLFIRLTRRVMGTNPFSELIIRDGVALPEAYDAVVIDAAAYGLQPSTRDPNNIQRLGSFVHNVDRVVVACPPERRVQWAFVLKALDIDAELCVPELDELGAVSMCQLGNSSTMVVSAGPMGLRSRLMKRGFDVALVLSVLPFLAIPMALVALAIKLESPGPVLFRQVRIGRGNRPFHILKFRSMRVELCDAQGNRSAGRDDDRITKVGNFIRKTSIDELPQILNVLLGSMSIVGPRPHAVGSRAENLLFWDIDDRYFHRHAVKPGLTGLAQIRGFRGATEVREDLSNRLQADLEYRANWSLLNDIMIIMATFRVLVHRNAF